MKTRLRTLPAIVVGALVLTLGTACGQPAQNTAADQDTTTAPRARDSSPAQRKPTDSGSSTRSPAPTGTRPPQESTPPGDATSSDFLMESDLPPTDDWTAHPVADGLPDQVDSCLAEYLPHDGARHRRFTAAVTQIVIRTGSQADAEQLVRRLRRSLDFCLETLRGHDETDDIAYKERFFGLLDVEDSAAVYGLEVTPQQSHANVSLYGVGSRGQRVTLTELSDHDGLADAPVDDFKITAKNSVLRLAG